MYGNGDIAQEFGFSQVLESINEMSYSLDELIMDAQTVNNRPQLAAKWRNVTFFQMYNPQSPTTL